MYFSSCAYSQLTALIAGVEQEQLQQNPCFTSTFSLNIQDESKEEIIVNVFPPVYLSSLSLLQPVL